MRKATTIVIAAIMVFAVACDTRPSPPDFNETTTTSTTLPAGQVSSTTVTLPPVEEQVIGRVVSITDGDTVRATVDGQSVEIRLLGINAPEIDECWGPEATSALAQLIQDRDVLLVSGPEDVDPFGRLLRYLYLPSDDDPVFVNAMMVETGNALTLQDGSDESRAMKSYEARAFQSGYGMWGTFACGDDEGVNADRPVIRVSEMVYDPAGADTDNLGGEYITIVNEGYSNVPMGGWTLRDESSSNRFVFPDGTTLRVGESITVSSGCSGAPTGALLWCADQGVWNNGGDTAILLDTLGNAVVWHSYSAEG